MLKVQLLMCETHENEIALIPLNPFCGRIQLDVISQLQKRLCSGLIGPGPTKCKSVEHSLFLGND